MRVKKTYKNLKERYVELLYFAWLIVADHCYNTEILDITSLFVIKKIFNIFPITINNYQYKKIILSP